MAGMRYQPQGLTRINPSHASTRGLGSLIAPLSGGLVDHDIAANILTAVSSSSLLKGAGPIGRCYVCAPTRAKVTTGFKMARVGTGDFTFLIVARANDSNFRAAVGPKKVYGGLLANQGAWKYSNGFAFTESGSSVNTTRPQVVILTRRAGVNYMCVDGKVSSGTAETTNYDQDEVSLFCRGGFDNDSTFSGDLYLFAGWYRGMSDAEMRALSNSPSAPWQLFADPEEDIELLSQAASDANGSFSSSLAALSMASGGAVINAGAFATSMHGASITASGAASAQPSGSFSSALSGVSFSATGALLASGSLSSTIVGAQMVSSGNVASPSVGALSSALDGATMAAYGYPGDAPMQAPNRRYRPRILRRHFTN